MDPSLSFVNPTLKIVSPILGIAVKLYTLCRQVKANKKRCQRLADRVRALEEIVKSVKHPEAVQCGLEELKRTLDDALEVVEKHTDASFLTLFGENIFHDLDKTFERLNERLNENSQQLSLALQIEQRDMLARMFAEARCREEDLDDKTSDHKELKMYEAQRALKTALERKYKCIFEGLARQGQQTFLNEIYTELYITEGESGGVNNEHEVRQIETAFYRQTTQETPILCNDIFKPLPGQKKSIRTVLTKGIAGIGKTVSVQKFILDWAEGKANQDVHFIFILPFRSLNLKKEKEFSLMELLQDYFPQLREIKSVECDEVKVLFIFDGLDECRLPLNFQSNQECNDITKPSSVDVLLTNLITRNLFPSALLWITSRPAAANKIRPECVDQVTEVRGFNDPQKEQYFRKRIGQDQASTIISLIKLSRSLDIMCHIPVCCWISATVLKTMVGNVQGGDTPKTLTEMYTRFVVIQTELNDQRRPGTIERIPTMSALDAETIVKLGKLAFLQLEKDNLIFHEEDLRESGIDVSEASVYSVVCTEIFKEECGFDQEKVYSFVHLSIQEYLAALFAFHSCINKNRNVFQPKKHFRLFPMKLSELHRSAVDQALKSKNGHLDLFLRFLLGLSLESVQKLLGGLLTQTRRRSLLPHTQAQAGSRSESIQKTVQYIKEKIRNEPSAERTINLFHCLNELKAKSLVEQIKKFQESGKLSVEHLEPHQCSALTFVLLMSEEIQEFDLKTYNTSAAGHQRLIPVIRNCKKAILNSCDLTKKSCGIVASALQSSNSPLRDLDLSYNNLGDCGVKLLCAGLRSPNCKLQRLGLNSCNLTKESCDSVASALQSSNSPLRDLDLSYNNLGDSGVKLLCARLKSPNCKLERLGLKNCDLTDKFCDIVATSLQSSNSPLRDLDLSYNNLEDSGVELLCAGLMSPNCKLQSLDLSYTNLRDSGVELLCAGLMSPNCKLERLGLGWCNLTEGCCDVLASVLHCRHSELRDLELRDNELQDSGVRAFFSGLEDPHCKLQRLGLSGCGVTQRGCDYLASALCSNPSHLRELDLRYNHPGNSGVRVLSAAKPDKLTLLVDHGGENRTKPGPRKYGCQFTLDPNTEHRVLSLSEGNRKVTHTEGKQKRFCEERFQRKLQVVCRESVCERCYWEAEFTETQREGGGVSIAVTDKGISRKGLDDCGFGKNKSSWSLLCFKHDGKLSYSVRHNENRTLIPAPSSPYRKARVCDGDNDGRAVCVYRVGVYVDRPAGTLSFYSVSDSDTLTLLHRFHTHFTQHTTLCAGFGVQNSSVSLCQLE